MESNIKLTVSERRVSFTRRSEWCAYGGGVAGAGGVYGVVRGVVEWYKYHQANLVIRLAQDPHVRDLWTKGKRLTILLASNIASNFKTTLTRFERI